jgi:hypothetical protein
MEAECGVNPNSEDLGKYIPWVILTIDLDLEEDDG